MKGKIRLLLVALILILLLAACSPRPAAAPEPATLTFVVMLSPWFPGSVSDYERLAEAFHAANPDVGVEVASVGHDQLSQNLADTDFLTDPEWSVDVVLTSAELFPELVQEGLIRDLQPSLDADQALQAGDFLPSVLGLLRWQGSVYGLPVEVDPWVMFYNQDLFDVAGVPYPSSRWRWNGFLEAAQALSAAGSARFPFGSWGAQVTPFVYQNGGTIVNDPIFPKTATLDDPAMIEAVRWYVNLALVEGVMPTPADLAGYATEAGRRQTILAAGDEAEKAASQAQADLDQAAASGDVAMWLGYLSGRGGRWQRWDFGWGILPLPAGQQTATLTRIQASFVTAHSKHFDQALRWMDYLTRQPPLHGGLPARRSAAVGDAVRSQIGREVEEALDSLLSALEDGLALPESLDWRATHWLQDPLFAILVGEAGVEEALEGAQQQAEVALGP